MYLIILLCLCTQYSVLFALLYFNTYMGGNFRGSTKCIKEACAKGSTGIQVEVASWPPLQDASRANGRLIFEDG